MLIVHVVLEPGPGLHSATVTAASGLPHGAVIAVQRTTGQPWHGLWAAAAGGVGRVTNRHGHKAAACRWPGMRSGGIWSSAQ